MFTTSCVFVSLFCCMLISNTSFYVQDNLVRPNWCQEVQNFVHMHDSPYPLSPTLRPITARYRPTGWPGPVGSLIDGILIIRPRPMKVDASISKNANTY